MFYINKLRSNPNFEEIKEKVSKREAEEVVTEKPLQ
jgi:hypothetical protein